MMPLPVAVFVLSDLSHSLIQPLPARRCVQTDEGEALSLEFGCQFHEVSAAESLAGVHLAFQSLLKETLARMIIKGLPKGRLSSPVEDTTAVSAVSRVIGNILSRAGRGIRKKRPSHSI